MSKDSRGGEPVACFKCGHAKHGGECVNVAPQPAEPLMVNAVFETENDEVIGTTDAKVKRVEWQDDGSLTVVIDYWPQPDEPDEWKLAVDHELTNIHSTADSYSSAKDAVKALIDWHVAVATDPVFQQHAEPVAWVSKPQAVEKQLMNSGKPRRVWWECEPGVGTPIYTAPQPAEPVGQHFDESLSSFKEDGLDLEVDDYVRCITCDYVGLVRAGADECPECGKETLMDEPKPDDQVDGPVGIIRADDQPDGEPVEPEGWRLVPKELIDFLDAKEHYLPVEDRHVLSIMLAAAPKFGEDLWTG